MSLVQFVALRLRELRSKHGLTQEQMADLLGTDVKWYQRIEGSAKDMRASTIDRLAAVFGLTASELLAKEIPDAKPTIPAPTAPHKPRKSTRNSG